MRLHVEHRLVWRMNLARRGFSSWELVDGTGLRWGWLVNAGTGDWTCHVGSWGAHLDLGLPPAPLEEKINTRPTAADGRGWVEEEIAAQWKEQHG